MPILQKALVCLAADILAKHTHALFKFQTGKFQPLYLIPSFMLIRKMYPPVSSEITAAFTIDEP